LQNKLKGIRQEKYLECERNMQKRQPKTHKKLTYNQPKEDLWGMVERAVSRGFL
jgi:hypothetical protein